jgi:putative colanic acid biosynthesis UDP-glucose lipid carrier transferase
MTRTSLRSHANAIVLFTRILDALTVGLSGMAVYGWRFAWRGFLPPIEYNTLILIAVLSTAVIFPLMGVYNSWRVQSLFSAALRVLGAWLWVLLGVFTFLVLMKSGAVYSRIWLVSWFIVVACLLVFERLLVYRLLRLARGKGFNRRTAVVVGCGELAQELVRRAQTESWAGFDVLAMFGCNASEAQQTSIKIFPLEALFDYVNEHQVDVVWIAVPLDAVQHLRDLLTKLRFSTANVHFVPDLFGFSLINHGVSEIFSMPMIDLSVTPMTGANRLIKWLEDRLLALLILAIISPLMLALAIGVKLSSPGPVFFRQQRLSWNGTVFNILKFRSMPVDVEQAGVKWGNAKNKQVTGLGAFMRRTSLDELPQFINVLKGDMSIVGPRPERPVFVEQFKNEIPGYMQKHLVKAGITGWAQVNGWRGDTDLHKRIEYDLYYIENWSLLFDLKIILLTIFKGFTHKNAY